MTSEGARSAKSSAIASNVGVRKSSTARGLCPRIMRRTRRRRWPMLEIPGSGFRQGRALGRARLSQAVSEVVVGSDPGRILRLAGVDAPAALHERQALTRALQVGLAARGHDTWLTLQVL